MIAGVKQYLLRGVGGTLSLEASWGPPDSSPAPVVTVYGGTVDADGDGIADPDELGQLDPLSVALTAATCDLTGLSEDLITTDVAIGDRDVTVSDTTSAVVGDKAWLTSELAKREQVVITGKSSSKIYLADPVKQAYDVSASPAPTIKGGRMSVDVPAGVCASIVRDGRAVFTYYVDGRKFVETVQYDCVLQVPEWGIEPSDLREFWIGFPDVHDSDGLVYWQRLIDGSTRDLHAMLEGNSFHPDRLRNPELARGYICAKTIERWWGSNPGSDTRPNIDYWRGEVKRYKAMIEDHLLSTGAEDDLLEIAWGLDEDDD